MRITSLFMVLRSNPTVMIVILLISAAIIALAVGLGVKKRNELLEAGKIVKRPYNFYDMAEIFTLGPVALQAIGNVLMRSELGQLGIQAQADYQNQRIIFRHGSWVGLLKYMGETGPAEMGGKSVYRLWISSYRTYRSSVQGAIEMNEMMTVVEKTLLGFDPNTSVSTEMVTRKSKTDFI